MPGRRQNQKTDAVRRARRFVELQADYERVMADYSRTVDELAQAKAHIDDLRDSLLAAMERAERAEAEIAAGRCRACAALAAERNQLVIALDQARLQHDKMAAVVQERRSWDNGKLRNRLRASQKARKELQTKVCRLRAELRLAREAS